MFYLDDGVLAGDIPAVSAALAHVQQEAARLGLSLNLSKCEAVVVGATGAAALQPHLPHALLLDGHGACRVLRNFEFLGAAIGDDAFCHDHTAARASKANRLLEAIAEMDDPQVALRLLRACGGFTRMVHSMRCTPPRSRISDLWPDGAHLLWAGSLDFTSKHLRGARRGAASRTLVWLFGPVWSMLLPPFWRLWEAAWLLQSWMGAFLAPGCGRLCGSAVRFGGFQCSPSTCPSFASGKGDGLKTKRPFLPAWMMLRGPPTLVLPALLPKQRCCQKPLLEDGPFLGLFLRARRAWRKPHSSQSCDCGWGWQMLRLIVGARGVMGSWTCSLITLEVALLAGSAPSATMPSAM